jgi:hypothetical protein
MTMQMRLVCARRAEGKGSSPHEIDRHKSFFPHGTGSTVLKFSAQLLNELENPYPVYISFPDVT